MGIGMVEVMALLLVLGVAGVAFGFWIWMLIDCATNETDAGNNKLVWILIIVFAHVIGALIYFFVRRPQRMTLLHH